MTTRRRSRSRLILSLIGTLLGLSFILASTVTASAASYITISGSGSSWAGNALAQWVADIKNQGVTVNYEPGGSSVGRKKFAQGIASFAVSEIPFTGDTADAQDNTQANFTYGMLPAVAGGTSFMYNLNIGGSRFEDLHLSQAAVAGIFSGRINRWNDPAIAADNPNVNLPDQRITVVVRADGSGATAQFTLWMMRQFPNDYKYLCDTTGACNPNAGTSYYPINRDTLPNFVAQSQSAGVTTYTQNTPFTINYDEYSYALQVGYPVAKVKNAAGFYTVPTAGAVAVALTQANISTEPGPNYLSQDLSAVYPYGDPRTYPLSMYSYAIVPQAETGSFNAQQGATLAYFLRHALCDGQEPMGDLGYSPLPMNLVLAALDQVAKIPGIDQATSQSIASVKAGALNGSGQNPCNNPTFVPGDSPSHNVLVDTAPFPEGCDAACQAPWKLAGSGTPNSGPTYEVTPGNDGGGAGGPAAQGGDSGTDPAAGPAAAGAGPASKSGKAGNQVCDPDTGLCTTGENTSASGNAKAVPAVIPGQLGWTTSQNLMLIAGLLTLGLVIAPPLISRLVRRAT